MEASAQSLSVLPAAGSGPAWGCRAARKAKGVFGFEIQTRTCYIPGAGDSLAWWDRFEGTGLLYGPVSKQQHGWWGASLHPLRLSLGAPWGGH